MTVTLDGGGDLYWLLLTSGFRTYRFLPVFFRSFYPRCDAQTSKTAADLLDAIAFERFGSRYDVRTGVVRFASPARAVADAARVFTTLDDVKAVVAEAIQKRACSIAEISLELEKGASRDSVGLRAALASAMAGVRSVASRDR